MSSIKLIKKAKNGCKKIHFDIHSPKLNIEYCSNCQARAQITNDNICECCGVKVEKPKNFKWIRKIMKIGCEQHKYIVRKWAGFPTKEPIFLEIRNKEIVYEIEIKYLALFEYHLNPFDIMPTIQNKLRMKGMRLFFPEDEETDQICRKCGDTLKLDKNYNVFCKGCAVRTQHSEELLLTN